MPPESHPICLAILELLFGHFLNYRIIVLFYVSFLFPCLRIWPYDKGAGGISPYLLVLWAPGRSKWGLGGAMSRGLRYPKPQQQFFATARTYGRLNCSYVTTDEIRDHRQKT